MSEPKTETPPRWDMTPIFPSLDSREFGEAFESFAEKVSAMEALFDRYRVGGGDFAEINDDLVSGFEEVVELLNDVNDHHRMIHSYVRAFVSTNTKDDLAKARSSEVERLGTALEKLQNRFEAWMGSIDVQKLIESSKVAAEHSFAIRRQHEGSRYRMNPEQENLYVELRVTGGNAWAKLHGQIASQVRARVRMPDGTVEELPMSTVSRGLARNPDEAVRRAAFEAEIEAWETVAVPVAAALNGIKGEVNTVTELRGWADPLEPSLFQNNVDRETFEAMQSACVESFPDFRRYLEGKAKVLGKKTLSWWDLNAPVGGEDGRKQWSYSEAGEFVRTHFREYSDRLAAFAERAFAEGWIDAESRVGKVDGAFCMGVRGEESRVLTNYEPSFHIVHSLAHELGHAYHNMNLARRTALNRRTPMALAETASTFCQTIVTQAALQTASDSERLTLLEKDLQEACQCIVDIYSRFLFETRVFGQRKKRELSVDEFKSLMLEAQEEAYGKALEPASLHGYMWAVKPHYYSDSSYYNWPYAFGLLFGLGLYTLYLEDPDEFRGGYDDLLSSTGLEDAATLTARFGFDITSIEFWRSSLDQLRGRIAEFLVLIG